ncbi:ectopic P granules protein 5 homolog isoform X2 [Ceratina calcarata]|uniref:Ectopic P granules protein 5 homolog isoform X2 n=1 Tax=Ceratina calcarata TaxID=156304 RepID=A0AAJ7NDN2_9HYME|nr:ectopic P granules protein 5 homolog isoform X2 [Ceratina calcarata]
MELVKQREKRKDRTSNRLSADEISMGIPDAPILEEFECLLEVEQVTNSYPQDDEVDYIERELRSAAIDCGIGEQIQEIETDDVIGHQRNLIASTTSNGTKENESVEKDEADKITVDVPSQINDVARNPESQCDEQLNDTAEQAKSMFKEESRNTAAFNKQDHAADSRLEENVMNRRGSLTSTDSCIKSLDEKFVKEDSTAKEDHVRMSKEKESNSSSLYSRAATLLSKMQHEERSEDLIDGLASPDSVKPFTDRQLASLYPNEELALLDSFINEFLSSHIQRSDHRHRLKELLSDYLRAKNHLNSNSNDLERLKRLFGDFRQKVWCLKKKCVTESGECQDGNPVVANHEFLTAMFDSQAYQSLQRTLGAIKDGFHESRSVYCYESEIYKLCIEYYIQSLIAVCKNLMDDIKNNGKGSTVENNVSVDQESISLTPISNGKERTSATTMMRMELRTCIAILFDFQRLGSVKDGRFITDTRDWLTRLVAILLRLATWQDHLFLLNHILRCPGGVTSWARSYVQAPMPIDYSLTTSRLSDLYLDHAVTVLATVLIPIRDRDKFLEQVRKSFMEPCSDIEHGDTVWLMLDEEGEEDEDIANLGFNLFESDVISLLNQIPFTRIFERALCIIRDQQNERFHQDKAGVTSQHLLRVFAFFTALVRILNQGLKTYDSPRYRQLTKKLSALIRDVLQYANDQWEAFDNSQIKDQSTLTKLQLEFDCFFLRSVTCIYSSRRLGAWQYLASIPYHMISSKVLWEIYYVLHVDFCRNQYLNIDNSDKQVNDWMKELNSKDLRVKFEERLSEMPGDESCYLLTTFANMAVARDSSDRDFIHTVTLDLFQTGFLSEKTRDCCSKDARPLLSNLINQHPSLVSVIVRKLGEKSAPIEVLSLYLFNALRLDSWIPEEEDMLILYNWLDKYPLSSNESHLARVIIGQLNWGLNESCDLCLPVDLHRQVALLIVEVYMKHVDDPGGQNASGMFVEGVKQVSSMIRWQNAEYQFVSWAWDVISKLKLHRLDQSDAVTRSTLMDPSSSLAGIPDMDIDPKLEILAKGVRDKKPLASYVAILMTMWGHSVPLICSSGFQQLEVLLANYKYEQALSCLYLMVPLFVECVDSSLIKNEKFLGIVAALLTADSNRASYMKAAKNLLSPEEFPGPLLRMFGDMIQSQLYSYKRYNLESPRDLVYLWLNTFMLIPDWNKDHSVMHLMDVVISSSFFHADAKIIVDRMFQNLFTPAIEDGNENATNKNRMASFGSFFNWATGSSSSNSLLGKSTQSVWVAYEVLLTEQYNREIKTGLWREILKELAGKTRVSLDTAIKRACATIKMQSFSSNSLSIYRWSQQALDTPMDHPILPLLWQNFFALFLARVPSASGVVDHGGVGEKFFEGMINLSYLKRLKKRLNDTTSYFQSKFEQDLEDTAGHAERGQEETANHYQSNVEQSSEFELRAENSSDQDGEDRVFGNRSKFCLDLARFYKTLSLWLEEPRLQEPGLYFPALPPQYMSQKLVELVHDNWTPWLEYVDYYQVQLSQLAAVKNWEKSSFRQEGHRNLPNSFMASDSLDPLRRICKRLLQYEDPIPAPPVTKNPEHFKNLISPACFLLYDADSLIEKVKKEVKTLTDYARTYFVMMSEYAAKDSDFLELVPKLYKVVENCVTLHALCDPVETNRRHSRVGERPVAVNCAGPAVITMKVPEAYINDSVDLMIAQNRAEYENLLVKSSQPPPSKVTQASVFMDHLVATLVHEITTIRNYVNASTNSLERLQQTGTRLFYYLIECYTEEVAYCPPTRQLITTCMERLGQSFINGEENEGPRLLDTVIDKPNLGSLLAPYFTPVAGSAVKFLQMYQTIVKYSTGTNMDLCFVLLSKFDVAVWLNHKRPRLSDRSRFIDLVAEALCEMGYNPDKTKLVLHELFRNHLRLVLSHDFPEHYGEVLSTLLRSSEGQNLSLDVWRDFLTTLTGRTRNNAFATFNCLKIRDEIRYYAIEQRLLSHQEIRETAVLLNRHFVQERLQYGLYGLYPKYRIYNEPLSVFLGMVGHAFVALTLQLDRGSLGDQLCDKIWPILNDMYSPWLAPYWTRNLKEPTAAWIQQLTDDRSVLLPWIISDGPYANKMVAMFVDCIRFILDTLPASNKILSSLWQSYVTNYAHPSVKEHVLNVIHGNFLTLPWDRFNPNLNDLELMVKILDQFLPDSHLFLGTVFISIDWKRWMSDWVIGNPSVSSLTRIHVCLINLTVKLANEANIRENDKAIQLVTAAEKFSWHLLDAAAYDHIINWYVTNCDPRHILQSSTGQCYPMDTAVNRLLKMAAGYDSSLNHFHPSTLKKRQLYIRSTVKMLNNCAARHKNLLLEAPRAFSETLSAILDDMEAVITNTVSESQQVAEASVLITEIMAAVNQHGTGHVEQLRLGWCSWLSKRSAGNPILVAVLKTIATVTEVPLVYGELMESALEAYFKFNVLEEVPPSWAEAMRILQSGVPTLKQSVALPLETVLVNEGKLLALYSILLKRLPSCQDIREEGMLLSSLMDWIAAIRPVNIDEEKLPLLWSKACELAYRQCLYNDTTKIAARALKSLSKSLLTFVDEGGQGGWAILDAIGLRKSSHLSPRCKFLCRATAVYCLAQLPECKSSVDQLVRYAAYSPGVAPTSNSETDSETDIRPSLEAVKAMQALEGLLLNKQFAEVKCDVERAIRLIKDPGNSLHNATAVIGTMATEIYNQRYLHVLID